jgi:hypothetical protein
MPSTTQSHKQSVEDRLSLGLALSLGLLLTANLDALEDVLTVLVELELGDDDVAGVDAEGDAGSGCLVAGDALDMNDILEAVDRGHLALLVLVRAADDLDLIILADGDAADLDILLVTFGKRDMDAKGLLHCTSHAAPCSEARS